MRRLDLKRALIGLGLVVLGGLSACSEPAPATPPNLLFISIDTLRADALGSYGGTWEATPFLDRFAEAGVRFTDAWSHSPKTAPSHMAMFTGLPPRTHGIGNQRSLGNQSLSADITTLAEALQIAGFRTGAVTSGGNVKGFLGFERGFEIYDETPKNLELKLRDAEEWMTRAAEESNGTRPWFFFFHTYAVHDPYLPPAKFQKRFADPNYAGEIIGDPVEMAKAVKVDDRAPWATSHQKVTENFWARVDVDSPADMRYLHQLYMASVASLDFQLRRFLNDLQRAGLLDNTIVVLTSDHGEELGEHGGNRHDQLWNELLHVPLIVHLPGDALVPPGADPETGAVSDAEAVLGRTVNGTVRHMDLVPSLIDLLGVENEVRFQQTMLGASWAPWLDDSSLETERPALSEHRSKLDRSLDIWALRSNGEMLILPAPDDVVRYVDRRTDPLEIAAPGQTPGVPAEGRSDLQALFDLWIHELGRFQTAAGLYGAGQGIELDAATRAELEGLGYL